MKLVCVKSKCIYHWYTLLTLILILFACYNSNNIRAPRSFPVSVEKSSSVTTSPKIHIAITVCGKAVYGVDALLTIKSIIAETVPYSAELTLSIVWDESQVINIALVEPLKDFMNKSFFDNYLHIRFIPAIPLPTDFEVPFGKCASQRLFFPENPYFDDIDSLIYVDTDTLFLKSPLVLWNEFTCFSSSHHTALANETNGGGGGYYRKRLARNHVPCSEGSCKCKKGKEDCKRFHGFYGLNSGVVLMNLTRIRKTNFQARIRIAMKKYRFFGDQDVYNHLFAEKDEVYVLPCTWNFRTDSRCNIVTGIGILHGNRKLFHRIGNFSSSELRPVGYFSSNYNRIRKMSWKNLEPHCLQCSSKGSLGFLCH